MDTDAAAIGTLPTRPPLDLAVPTTLETASFAFG